MYKIPYNIDWNGNYCRCTCHWRLDWRHSEPCCHVVEVAPEKPEEFYRKEIWSVEIT